MDVHSRDNEGRSPLSYAAEHANEGTVSLLLQQGGVDINSHDNSDRSPLSYAAEYGHNITVQILLVREDVNVSGEDNEGKSALDWANCQPKTEYIPDGTYWNRNRKRCAEVLQARMVEIEIAASSGTSIRCDANRRIHLNFKEHLRPC